MHHETGRFVDDQDRVVFENDTERNVFRAKSRFSGVRLDLNHDCFTPMHFVAGTWSVAIDGDMSVADPLLQTASRVVGKQNRHYLVHSFASQVIRDDTLTSLGNGGFSPIMRRVLQGIHKLSLYPRRFPGSLLLPTQFRLSGPLFLLIVLLLFSGCSGKKQDITRDWPADRLYYAARSEMSDRRYEKAIDYYQKLQARYPYGRFAQQGMIDMAYAYWKHEQPELALATCDRFIREHPNHLNIDYVYFLKGRINFNEDQGLIGLIHKKDLADTDPVAAREAFNAFKILTTRFPNSRYAPDARERMVYLVDALARHDTKVAAYYFRRGAYVAAVNRAQDIITTYPRTPAVEQALGIMVASYKEMGLDKLSEDAQRTLNANFPGSKVNFEPKKQWWKFW